MPVQINEVIIRTTVSNGSAGAGSSAAVASPAANAMDNATLVEQIMETIRNKNER